MSEKIREEHLRRGAFVYVRQSTMTQVVNHKESQRRQYALADRARHLGFATVDVIDDDLGKSGSGVDERPGFQRLVAAVCAGKVGAVFSIEASRLARNGRDWHTLVDLCGLADTLVVDAEGVYDPRLSNDRLLLGLKGTMSEFELSIFRERSFEALRMKARRGALRFRLPVGLRWSPTEKIELDPDRRVQEAIHLVFRKFGELGSVRQVLLWFCREDLSLPFRGTAAFDPTVAWRSPRYQALHKMLTNAQYAGAYAFGKTSSRTLVVDGKAQQTRGHAKARDKWTVLIHDHHPGYISWETYERNQQMIADNAHMKNLMQRKAGRGGHALLAGMLRCRRCGRMLAVGYGGLGARARYMCRGAQLDHGAPECQSFGASRPDRAIAAALIEAIQPKAIDAALEAVSRVEKARDDEVRAVQLELEQARYEAQLASRRYEAADPDNRLVAAELEARWNASMLRVRELEARVDTMTRVATPSPPIDRAALLSLAANLPAVWNSEIADNRLKQRIVRMLIQEIVADVDVAAREIILVVHWMGGRHTEIRTEKPRAGAHGRATSADCFDIVKGMAGRWSDEEIAATLNRLRLHTGTGKTWSARRVYQLRNDHELPAYDPARPRDTVTLEEATRRLGVSNTVVKKLIAAGTLLATQAAPAAPWEISIASLDAPEVRSAVARTHELGRAMRAAHADKRTLTLPGIGVT
jgi:DNA invertase Pin-like site-specific DNA recombinase